MSHDARQVVGRPSDTPKLRCPACGETLSRVIDSRTVGVGDTVIRRRRVCASCDARYSTIERVVAVSIRRVILTHP